MITIHLWGYESTCQPSLISPESIALYWFLKEEADRVSREDIEIVFSNNPSLSPNYHLPLLIDKQEGTVDPKDGNGTLKKQPATTILSGYDNITRYLTTRRASDDAMSSALLQFVADDVGSLTEWALYSNRSNFDGFTRGEHSRLLQCEHRLFLGGASATSVRASVLKRLNTEEEGEEATVTEEATTAPEDLAQSKVFKLRLENRRQRTKRELREFTHKIAYLSRLVDAFRRWREATTTAASSSSSFAVTTATRLLLRAHLRVQLSLPDTGDAARDRLSAEFSEEFVNGVLQGKSSSSSSSTTPVHHRAPLYWTETPNFVSSALNWCYYRWSQ